MKRNRVIFPCLCGAVLSFAQTEVSPTIMLSENDTTGIIVQSVPDSLGVNDYPVSGLAAYRSTLLFLSSNTYSGFNGTYTAPITGTNGVSESTLPRWLAFSTSAQDYPGLMRTESGSIGISGQIGKFGYDTYAGAIKYASFNSLVTSYYVGGQVTYFITSNISATAFGTYYTRNPYFGMAALPYVQTTNFGGYITVAPNSDFSLSLGAKSYYDPFGRRMEVDPIIAPTVKVGKVRIGVDFGHAAKHYLRSLFQSWSK